MIDLYEYRIEKLITYRGHHSSIYNIYEEGNDNRIGFIDISVRVIWIKTKDQLDYKSFPLTKEQLEIFKLLNI